MKACATILTLVSVTCATGSPAELNPLPQTAQSGISNPASLLQITDAKSRADGSFELRVESPDQLNIVLESSGDLKEWSSEGLWEPNSLIVLTNRNLQGSRFYRASDFTLRIQGTVRDIQSDHPVGDAKVTISGFSWMFNDIITQTDAQGVFHVRLSREHPVRKITVEKSGYDLLTTEPRIASTDPQFEIPLWLTPPGYRPANDDFQNRFTLHGTNIAVHARTLAATSEPGHELEIWFDDYTEYYPRNLWWTWTAAQDGALLIEKTSPPVAGGSGVVVYTGQSLPELVRVWDTYLLDAYTVNDAFFVKQGVQYQIAFGTAWPADTGFSLRMVAPVPPFAVAGWVGDLLVSGSPIRTVGEAFSLTVWARGTSPLQYQWRKDGIDIPNATNAFFFKEDLQLTDAGLYSARAANEAGTATSNEIQITVLPKQP